MDQRRLAIALAGALLLLSAARSARAQAAVPGPGVDAQIRALQAEKRARAPAQRKIGSRLLHAARMQRGVPVAEGIPALRTGVAIDAAGRALIDLHADVTPALRARIEALGGEVVSAVAAAREIRARLPLAALETLAAEPGVQSIRPADRAMTHMRDVSEGDVAHRAIQARTSFGVDGTGIAVGVLSDGVDALASLQASGDLPPGVTVLPGQAGSGSEGTAMLEIVHDLAPGAQLLFATAFNSQASFAANIGALRNAGADVIVDDVAYFAEAVFQDDDVAAAVDAAVARGALYFSAAGNEGNWNDGTAGVWQGDFAPSGQTLAGNPIHAFGSGVTLNEVTVDSPFLFTLHWADALGASANDYDLYLLNKAGSVIVAASTDTQDGNDDPFEAIDSFSANDRGRKLLVVHELGDAGRYLHLNANRGRLALATSGQTSGHAGAEGAMGVAAVDVRVAAGAGGVFAGTEPVERYSSDGPRRIFYEANGTPITPGNFSATGGELRAKPDLAAADCVSTNTPGFATFCGTSAAAPHAAAIAALLLDLGATPGEARSALASTALDIEASGPDRDSGAGIAQALAAASAAAPTACENGTDDDGDGRTDLADPGCADAADTSEHSAALPCDNGLDDDGDGFVDFSAAPGGDPGCRDPGWALENPECQDGLNNDPAQDALIDHDGGASAGLPPQQQTEPDPQCAGEPWRTLESQASPSGCGIGPELALLALLGWRRRPLR